MALTLVELAEAVRKYALRGTFSDHDKAALQRNLDLFVGRAGAVTTGIKALSLAAEPALADVPTDYFADGEGNEVYIVGGSPSNPNGVTFTFGDAIRWWRDVFGHGYNISKVRASLTPGSHVLTPDGIAAAEDLGKTSTDYAPEDYNPLDLPVIP